jgi:antitoxin (DNA-binding transcriptional repressor) of toxin-antitoxin stability system
MKIKGKTFTATEFKAKCLRILDDLGPQGIIILKRGRPVAKLTPLSHRRNAELIGLMKGKIVVKGDIFSTGVSRKAISHQQPALSVQGPLADS